jgi:hypothetical protein
MKNIRNNFGITLALLSGVIFISPVSMYAQTADTTVVAKPAGSAVLAPAQEPTMGTPPDASVEGSVNAAAAATYAFPSMLPDQDLPATASALTWFILTEGINPFLAVLGLALIVFLVFRYRLAPRTK